MKLSTRNLHFQNVIDSKDIERVFLRETYV